MSRMETTEEAIAGADAVLDRARVVSRASVDDAVRGACRARLVELAVHLREHKRVLVEAARDEDANRVLASELSVSGAVAELDMWSALADGHAHEAWRLLVDAQQAANSALRIDSKGHRYSEDVERRKALECVLFPPQVFLSGGMIVHEADCSICGGSYRDCSHVKGRAYQGQMCVRIIKKADLREASIVLEPSDKTCLASFNGVDPLTLIDPAEEAG